MYFQAWRRYFDFLGDATRTEYWTFTLINLAIVLALAIGWYLTGENDEAGVLQWNIVGYVGVAFILLAIIPSLTVAVRRVRDATGSGWWLLTWFIPFVGPIVVLVITLKPSKQRWW